MAEIDLSKISSKDLEAVRERVLKDLLKEASRRSEASDNTADAPHDKHSSYHSKG